MNILVGFNFADILKMKAIKLTNIILIKILNINDKVLPRILSKKDEIKVITVSITINECIRYHIKPVIQTCKLSGDLGDFIYLYLPYDECWKCF